MAFDAHVSPAVPIDLRPRIGAAIDDLALNIGRLERGEISTDTFRPLRLAMGIYAQLAHVKHMQRVKIPGGRMTADQVDALAEMTDRWGKGLAHVTTRQDIQIHHLEISDAPELLHLLAKAGISTVGACMDTVRNVTASPLAGVAADEAFDVTPYAEAIERHFMFHELNRRLPRKFKIGLSGGPSDRALVMINDVGLFAMDKGGERGFRVYVAGGLGATPEVAHPWLDFVPEADLLAVCEAVVHVYHRDGERKNRKKNRLKFLLRKLGEAELLRRLDDELLRIQNEHGAELRTELASYVATYAEAPPPALGAVATSIGDARFARWKRTNTVAQAQVGYRAVTIKLPLGDITGAGLRRVAELARAFGNGEVRATLTQNLVLRWIPEHRVAALHRELAAVGLAEADADHITDVVSCPGADFCSLAITKSMGLATRIREHLVPENERSTGDFVADIGPLAVKVSGCPNSCGQHHIADIGLTGLMVTGKDGVERPHYSIRVGGRCGEDARFGRRLDGRVPEEDAPKVIGALAAHYVRQRYDGETFTDFVERVGVEGLAKEGLAVASGVV